MYLMSRFTISYLLIAFFFAWVHYLAMLSSLYWYYWWFDVFMHFWGGLLVGAGVVVLCGLKSVKLKPTLLLTLLSLLLVTVSWEAFEWYAGLYNPLVHTADTLQDISIGFCGGLIAFFSLKRFNKSTI